MGFVGSSPASHVAVVFSTPLATQMALGVRIEGEVADGPSKAAVGWQTNPNLDLEAEIRGPFFGVCSMAMVLQQGVREVLMEISELRCRHW